MKTKWIFTRNFDAGKYLENFLVAAVGAVLVIRLFLKMTGYPQIGGSSLHIAHMLWGGLLMLVSIIILLSFLNRASEQLASIIGGIGFGTFIDEVGKFVTRDNDYFFKPAVAIIYVTFMLVFIAIRAIQSGRTYSRNEYLMNALREMQEGVLHELDEEDKNKAFYYLNKSNPSDPLVPALRSLLINIKLVPSPSPGFYTRFKIGLRNLYQRITRYRAFSIGIVIFFLFQLIVTLAYAIVLIFFVGLGWDKILNIKIFDHIATRVNNLSFIEWAELSSSLLSGFFVLTGVFSINRSRIFALRMFERSILVTIFLTQVFIFYKEQFAALAGLSLNILILIALRFMIEREQAEVIKEAKRI
jgi:hypothetical protein